MTDPYGPEPDYQKLYESLGGDPDYAELIEGLGGEVDCDDLLERLEYRPNYDELLDRLSGRPQELHPSMWPPSWGTPKTAQAQVKPAPRSWPRAQEETPPAEARRTYWRVQRINRQGRHADTRVLSYRTAADALAARWLDWPSTQAVRVSRSTMPVAWSTVDELEAGP